MNIHKEDLFFIIFPIVSILSTFALMNTFIRFIDTGNGAFYFDKLLFWFLSIMVALFTLKIFNIIDGLCSDKRKVYFTTIILSAMFIFYISLFQHSTNQEVFFIDLFSVSLPINITLSILISLCAYKFINRKIAK